MGADVVKVCAPAFPVLGVTTKGNVAVVVAVSTRFDSHMVIR